MCHTLVGWFGLTEFSAQTSSYIPQYSANIQHASNVLGAWASLKQSHPLSCFLLPVYLCINVIHCFSHCLPPHQCDTLHQPLSQYMVYVAHIWWPSVNSTECDSCPKLAGQPPPCILCLCKLFTAILCDIHIWRQPRPLDGMCTSQDANRCRLHNANHNPKLNSKPKSKPNLNPTPNPEPDLLNLKSTGLDIVSRTTTVPRFKSFWSRFFFLSW